MTDADKARFAQVWTDLTRTFSIRADDPDVKRVWWDTMKFSTIDDVEAGARDMLGNFEPKGRVVPANLMGYVRKHAGTRIAAYGPATGPLRDDHRLTCPCACAPQQRRQCPCERWQWGHKGRILMRTLAGFMGFGWRFDADAVLRAAIAEGQWPAGLRSHAQEAVNVQRDNQRRADALDGLDGDGAMPIRPQWADAAKSDLTKP